MDGPRLQKVNGWAQRGQDVLNLNGVGNLHGVVDGYPILVFDWLPHISLFAACRQIEGC